MAVVTMLLMLLLMAGAVALMKKSRAGGADWAKPAASVCAVGALVLALVRVMAPPGSAEARSAVKASERFQEVGGTYVGQALIEGSEGAPSVVLLVRPGWKKGAADKERILVEALQRTLENRGAGVELTELPIPDEVLQQYMEGMEGADAAAVKEMEQNLALDYAVWFTPRRLRALLTELKGTADYAVFTMPLSRKGMEKALPGEGAGPRVVLLDGSRLEFPVAALKKTSLHAVLLERDDSSAWQPGSAIPEDLDEAFHQRYLWVTESNAASLAGTHSQL